MKLGKKGNDREVKRKSGRASGFLLELLGGADHSR